MVSYASTVCLLLLLSLPIGWAADTTPAVVMESDTGKTLPISLFRGRVTNQNSRYILGPGDTVSLKVNDLEKFDQTFMIRPDGYATLNPFGERYLAGTDIEGLTTWLKQELKLYLVNPQVTVNVDSMRPAMIYVKGAVQHPGTYQFIRDKLSNVTAMTSSAQERAEITLTNVLSKAGGITINSDISNITVLHAYTGQKEIFNLREFLMKHAEPHDIWLLPEDTVIVPELSQSMDIETFKLVSNSTFFRDKFPVIVLGAVQKQGEVQIDPTNNSLNAAVALAGGFVPGLSKRDMLIIQRPSNQGGFNRWVVNRAKSNLELLPGDVVYVPDSKTFRMERGFSLLGHIIQPFYYSISGSSVLKNNLFNINN
jgi:polysaccharide export outer membrane protein